MEIYSLEYSPARKKCLAKMESMDGEERKEYARKNKETFVSQKKAAIKKVMQKDNQKKRRKRKVLSPIVGAVLKFHKNDDVDPPGGCGEEAPIAAFAVSRGGVVLKNIFLNAPPSPLPVGLRKGQGGEGMAAEEEEDPPVMFGRHPDCHVLVDHPSVSRFHLEIRSRRRLRRITVTDLSSVHGTWVSGQRIPPNTPVELAAGDILRLGGSKREYRLHWLSLREAFDMEDLLPPLLEEDKEEPRTCQEAIKQLEPDQKDSADTKTLQETRQQVVSEQTDFQATVVPSAPPMPEFANFLALEESSVPEFDDSREGRIVENLIDENPVTDSVDSSITQPMPATVENAAISVKSGTISRRTKLKSVKTLRIDTGRSKERVTPLSYSYQKEENQNENSICSQKCGIECEACIVLFKNSNVREAEEKEIMDISDRIVMEESGHEGLTLNLDGTLIKNENLAPSKIFVAPEVSEFEDTVSENLFENLDMKGTDENEENSPLDEENITPYVSRDMIAERSQLRLKPATISQELMDSISPLNLEHDNFSDNENSMLSMGKQMISNEFISKNLVPLISVDANLQMNHAELMPISHLDSKDGILTDKENPVLSPEKYDTISPVRQGNLFPDKENMTPDSRDLKPIVGRKILGTKVDNSLSAECTSNRRIHRQEPNELSAKSKVYHAIDDDVFYSDKENLTPISSGGIKARRCLPRSLTVDADQDQESFYSDKENLTPVSSARKKTKDLSENRARMESAITKKRVVDRLPFQTLLSNSPLRHTSSLDCTQVNPRAVDVAIKLEDELYNVPHKRQGSEITKEGMKVWTMVTDMECLLDDESRKSIMLLRGLKGTQLVIPMIVIRELECLKKRERLFKISTKATSILQWINECMEKESWWIHVQSSSEMLPVAPTPPATPTALYNDEEKEISAGTFNLIALFSPRSFAGIVSPKTEDRVLDCALLFNKLKSNQNIVILSNRTTLKIKAMAEGLPCEGAKEFWETLVNPCSSRFMWAASAPRGSAWSCLDETTLEENYYNSHRGARSRIPRSMEAAKGLKLILLHNSHYGQATNSVENRPLAPMASW
uniref:FHA domain-containing protein n=1 Tax=Leersia perrieri TaxID=77586 RepID=A0A0D9XPI9_9ORYZ